MALVDQLPALMGVVIGTLGSYAVQSLTERRRWTRQREERWDEKRFETYGRYGNALKSQLRVAQRIGAALGAPDTADPLEPAEGLPLLAEAESHRATEWESVLLVGDAATIAAARRWHEMVWTIELLVREGPVEAEMWTRAHRLASAARDAFYESARRDLGIAGAPPPPGEWPRSWRAELSG
ncbi:MULTISPECIES: hypothetical protein [Streptomyces]|uniref:Secreted protein n=1 Tax=Streptomyces venezuelae TaxID=54571 RepID=A0A5P2BIV3_STRVZ|nr:hypothetical protein [Streptomyces venezuelae]MYY85193.1 hypothetical protein [Streptomyces sp. SID335]MYZ14219.1 hypothetical protein [Streptomyces sp. SID337]NDZ84964.1 hypothetical protein [Streptomyces sp. SID10115]NEA04311.1 hypothetical protein [Streptomyces sp. SID10116]NEB46315.1 hypothetical protein [Streptomyces sp. SID339]